VEFKTFVNEFHPSTRIYADNHKLIFAGMQRILRHDSEGGIVSDERLIVVSSAKKGSDVLPIKHPSHIFDIMSRDTVIVTGMLKLSAKEYPFAQRGFLRHLIQDPEANKLIDGLPDQYTVNPQTPTNIDEAIHEHYADIVAREESTTMFAISDNREVARLGNAILFPVEPAEYLS